MTNVGANATRSPSSRHQRSCSRAVSLPAINPDRDDVDLYASRILVTPRRQQVPSLANFDMPAERRFTIARSSRPRLALASAAPDSGARRSHWIAGRVAVLARSDVERQRSRERAARRGRRSRSLGVGCNAPSMQRASASRREPRELRRSQSARTARAAGDDGRRTHGVCWVARAAVDAPAAHVNRAARAGRTNEAHWHSVQLGSGCVVAADTTASRQTVGSAYRRIGACGTLNGATTRGDRLGIAIEDAVGDFSARPRDLADTRTISAATGCAGKCRRSTYSTDSSSRRKRPSVAERSRPRAVSSVFVPEPPRRPDPVGR